MAFAQLNPPRPDPTRSWFSFRSEQMRPAPPTKLEMFLDAAGKAIYNFFAVKETADVNMPVYNAFARMDAKKSIHNLEVGIMEELESLKQILTPSCGLTLRRHRLEMELDTISRREHARNFQAKPIAPRP